MKDKTITESVAKLFGGVCELLTIIFIALRACGIIAWKWWQLMLPMFIQYGVLIVTLIVIGLAICIAAAKGKGDDL